MEKKKMPDLTYSLTFKQTGEAMSLYEKAFGAKVVYRMDVPGGGVAHAEMMFGDTLLYMSDEAPEWHASAMPEGMMSSSLLSLASEDCDVDFKRAVDAGLRPLSEPEDQFWGGRTAILVDPWGYRWSLVQTKEVLSPEEIQRRAQELMSQS